MQADAQTEQLIRLSNWLRRRYETSFASASGHTFIVGIVGLPGCGKSTLAKQLLDALALPRSLSVSLDDFYLTADERRALGLRFRGPPGTHALPLLNDLLEKLATCCEWIEVPVFDRGREQRLPQQQISGPVDLMFIEGWFVGARCPGYQRLADALDLLIFIDMDEGAARAARIAREATLRKSGHGGMNEQEVVRFWESALAPHFAELVFPLRERAEAIVSIDAAHRITQLALDRPVPCRAPPAVGRAPRPEPSDGGST